MTMDDLQIQFSVGWSSLVLFGQKITIRRETCVVLEEWKGPTGGCSSSYRWTQGNPVVIKIMIMYIYIRTYIYIYIHTLYYILYYTTLHYIILIVLYCIVLYYIKYNMYIYIYCNCIHL